MNVVETNLKFKSKLKNRSMTKKIVVHHSDSGPVDARTIHQWHLNKGWAGIGYHYVIKADGAIERGRPELAIGAHAQGGNSDSIGICLAGNFMGGAVPTTAQMDSLVWLIKDIRKRYAGIPAVRHKDVTPTSCPGDSFPWQVLQDRLKGEDKVNVDEALTILAQKEIISDKAYWKNVSLCVKYFDSLLINMASKLKEA